VTEAQRRCVSEFKKGVCRASKMLVLCGYAVILLLKRALKQVFDSKG
jgi:hypothetical protein